MTYDGTRDCAAEVAEATCKLYREGKRGVFLFNGISIELDDLAWCSEAVREWNAAADGRGPFFLPYWGRTARETETKLKGAGRKVTVPGRGDIVCFNTRAGKFGHIGLYLGRGKFAENTSSPTRGPGFVISSLANMTGRISGYYTILPPRATEPAPEPETRRIYVIEYGTDPPVVLARFDMVKDGDHIRDQGKVYTLAQLKEKG